MSLSRCVVITLCRYIGITLYRYTATSLYRYFGTPSPWEGRGWGHLTTTLRLKPRARSRSEKLKRASLFTHLTTTFIFPKIYTPFGNDGLFFLNVCGVSSSATRRPWRS